MTDLIFSPIKSLRLTPFSAIFSDTTASFLQKISLFLNAQHSGRTEAGTEYSSTTSSGVKKNFKKNKFFYIPLAIILLLLLGGVFSILRGNSTTSSSVIGATGDDRLELKPAIASQNINKTFSFPLKDAQGKEVSKIQFTIEKAELRDEIIVKGQRATSVKGRTFLILPVKITNSFNQPVEINARDYVRLSINNSSDKLAPDIHNDPVEVQAISTKQTRIGFPVDDDVKSLVLQVGEIKGDKENITLNLKK